MKLKTILSFAFVTLAFKLTAQDYKQKFTDAFHSGDTTTQLIALKQWRKAAPNDPQLYINWFNYYAFKSRKEVIALEKGPGGAGSFDLQNKNKQTVANMSGKITWDASIAAKGLAYIDTGITKFPDQLDMRFGKTYLLGQLGDFESFTREIINALNYGVKTQHKWKWSGGKPLEDPQNFFLSAEQDYVVQLFNAGDENIKYIKQLAEATLKIYPDNVPNLSNLGIACMLTEHYDDALKPLLKANTLAPGDHVVLNNIAYCYELKKDKANAIKYYKIASGTGSPEQQKDSQQKIVRLEKGDK